MRLDKEPLSYLRALVADRSGLIAFASLKRIDPDDLDGAIRCEMQRREVVGRATRRESFRSAIEALEIDAAEEAERRKSVAKALPSGLRRPGRQGEESSPPNSAILIARIRAAIRRVGEGGASPTRVLELVWDALNTADRDLLLARSERTRSDNLLDLLVPHAVRIISERAVGGPEGDLVAVPGLESQVASLRVAWSTKRKLQEGKRVADSKRRQPLEDEVVRAVENGDKLESTRNCGLPLGLRH